MLTSPDNPKIKEVIALRKANYRRQAKRFVIEGYQEFKLALSSNVSLEGVYFHPEFFARDDERELLGQAQAKGASLFEVNERVYNKIAFGSRREGLVAIARQWKLSLADLRPCENPFLVVAEGIEKPGNLGAIIRTADAAGVDALIVSGAVTDIYNPNVVRSSLGTLFCVKVIKAEVEEALSWLKAQHLKIVCANVQGKLAYTSMDFRAPCAIVLGSEEKGISAMWKDNADEQVYIPMAGRADSLNVSVAAGLLLFEVVRQRMG